MVYDDEYTGMRREKPHISIERNISTYYSPIRSADKSRIIDNKSMYIYFCKVFGRNYLVRLRPFGRSCRAMEPTMNRTACEKSIYMFMENKQSTTMIAQVSTTLTTSAFITYRPYCDRLSFFLFPPSFPISSFLQ